MLLAIERSFLFYTAIMQKSQVGRSSRIPSSARFFPHSSSTCAFSKKSGGASGTPASTSERVTSVKASQDCSVRAILSGLPLLLDLPFESLSLCSMRPLARLSSSERAAMMELRSLRRSWLPVVDHFLSPMRAPSRPPRPPRRLRRRDPPRPLRELLAAFFFSAAALAMPCSVQDMTRGTAQVPASEAMAAVQMSGHQWFATVSMSTYFCRIVSTYVLTFSACAAIPLDSSIAAKSNAS
mmetsp:Transcript_4441/g.9642  ORF Transcript_4441/g.9642 Transcript_4441/m.9642 type:complete len:239 (+) Transcript_4441:80-796(+)